MARARSEAREVAAARARAEAGDRRRHVLGVAPRDLLAEEPHVVLAQAVAADAAVLAAAAGEPLEGGAAVADRPALDPRADLHHLAGEVGEDLEGDGRPAQDDLSGHRGDRLDRAGVAKVIEFGARIAEDKEKLVARFVDARRESIL